MPAVAVWGRTIVALAGLTLGPAAVHAQAVPDNKPATVEGTAKNIAEAPLKDLNIIKPKVPPLLETALKKPYDLTGIKTCPQFQAAIKALDGVLGPDVDSPQLAGKGDAAAEFALKGTQDIVTGLIPGGGIIRRVTGADKEAKHAVAAVYAGGIRRAYLKGTARAKACKA